MYCERIIRIKDKEYEKVYILSGIFARNIATLLLSLLELFDCLKSSLESLLVLFMN